MDLLFSRAAIAYARLLEFAFYQPGPNYVISADQSKTNDFYT